MADDMIESEGRRYYSASHEDSIKIRLGIATGIPGEMVFALALFMMWNCALYFTGMFQWARLSFDPVLIGELLCYELLFLIVVYSLQRSRVTISMFMVAIYFSLFLLFPGIHHTLLNSFPFYGMSYSNDELLSSVAMLLFFLLSLFAGYITASRQSIAAAAAIAADPARAAAAAAMPKREILIPRIPVGLIVFGLAGMISVLAIAKIGLQQFVHVRGQFSADDAASKSDIGLFLTLPRALTFISLLYWLAAFRFGAGKKALLLFVLVLNVPLFLVINFPPALPRFVLFGYILSVLMLIVDIKRKRARYWIFIGFTVGALFLMPIMNALTRGGETLATLDVSDAVGDYMESGDFDGLQSMNNAVIFVRKEGFQYGRQLASGVFFFVPRSIWAGKGDPTGSLTAQAAGYKFFNISQPLPSEFFVDFGLPGVIILAFLAGYGIGRLDEAVDRLWYAKPTVRLWSGFVAGYGVIILRGPILGVIAGIAINALGIYIITRFGFVHLSPADELPPGEIAERDGFRPIHSGPARPINA